jgi:hypothetical protein
MDFMPFISNPNRNLSLSLPGLMYQFQTVPRQLPRIISLTDYYLSGVIVLRWPKYLRCPSTDLAILPEYDGMNTSLSTEIM